MSRCEYRPPSVWRCFETAPPLTALAQRLYDDSREVRVAAALALASCGRRDSVEPLLDALDDDDPLVAQAASVALENLTGHSEPFQPFTDAASRAVEASRWRDWCKQLDWNSLEASLITRLVD